MLTPEELREIKGERTNLNRLGAALAEPDEKSPTIYSQKYIQCSIQKLPKDKAADAREYLDLVILVNDLLKEPINFKEVSEQIDGLKNKTIQAHETIWSGTEANPIHIDDYTTQVSNSIKNQISQLSEQQREKVQLDRIQIRFATKPIQDNTDQWIAAEVNSKKCIVEAIATPYIYHTEINIPTEK